MSDTTSLSAIRKAAMVALLVPLLWTGYVAHSMYLFPWQEQPEPPVFTDDYQVDSHLQEPAANVTVANDTVRPNGTIHADVKAGVEVELWDPRRQIIVDMDTSTDDGAALYAPETPGTYHVYAGDMRIGDNITVVEGETA